SAQDFREWSRLTQLSAFLPVLFMAMLWTLCRTERTILSAGHAAPAGIAAQLESFIDQSMVRLQLFPLVLLIIGAGLGLSGQPMRAVLPRGIVLAAVILLGLRPLLKFA